MPAVAAIVKPARMKRRAASMPVALSRSARDMNTQPCSGSRSPAASWLLAKASPKVESMPITSPVDRISGPSTLSASGKRLKGSTASLMAT